jgi:hypothetical protein
MLHQEIAMPRNMSFALTTEQIKNRTKTVTRRFGWWFLKQHDPLNAVEKAMGLKKGEQLIHLAKIRIVSARGEPLSAITQDDCIKEGFPDLTPDDFIEMILKHYKIRYRNAFCNRIEFEYIEDEPQQDFLEMPAFLRRGT